MVHQQTVADPGEGPGGPAPLLLDQNEAQRGEKNFFGDRAPRYLRVWISAPPPRPLISRSGSGTASYPKMSEII